MESSCNTRYILDLYIIYIYEITKLRASGVSLTSRVLCRACDLSVFMTSIEKVDLLYCFNKINKTFRLSVFPFLWNKHGFSSFRTISAHYIITRPETHSEDFDCKPHEVQTRNACARTSGAILECSLVCWRTNAVKMRLRRFLLRYYPPGQYTNESYTYIRIFLRLPCCFFPRQPQFVVRQMITIVFFLGYHCCWGNL